MHCAILTRAARAFNAFKCALGDFGLPAAIMDYDLGFFDSERGRVGSGPNPFAPDKVLTMCPKYVFL